MVWRSTTSNYNQSEILNYTCGCFLVRRFCRGVHFISSSLHKLLSVYNTCDIYFWWYTLPIHNTTITCLADIYKSFKTKLNLYISDVNFESMFQNKQDCPLIVRTNRPQKNSNILLNGTSINAIGPMYLVSYRRKLTCTCMTNLFKIDLWCRV